LTSRAQGITKKWLYHERTSNMPLARIAADDFTPIGRGVERPEDVVVGRDGTVWCSDIHCTVARIAPDGSFTRHGPKGGAPNGINMDASGRILIANFGVFNGSRGPLEGFEPTTGDHTTLVSRISGRELTSCNYPVVARDGTIWCTHSTFADTWMQALDGRDDGFVFAVRPDGRVDVAATGVAFANGCCLDADEEFLYVNRTSLADVVRFPIRGDGSLGPMEVYSPKLGPVLEGGVDPANPPSPEVMHHLGYTDGNGFDEEGNLWVTLPAANKIVAVTPAREVFTVAHDPGGEIINHPTNVTWGGADMKDLYIGSLYAPYVLKTRSPVAGLRMAHQR
jgi:gluconolactonase